ncbi:IS66 family transposase [Paenibacillus dendritiformis]|uniref:IS66 family transposase n=1 Tax=Paenibacillus dendritiformis TaxID=130049 RepID=UPI0018CDCFFD
MLPVYETVARWRKPLKHIANILEPRIDRSRETARWEMTALLGWMKQTYTQTDDVPIVENILRYTNGFWNGLFTCYDEYHLPRTNNDLERFFRQTKANHRRITGLRNWNTYIQRNGELIVLIQDALRQEHIENCLRSVGYSTYMKYALPPPRGALGTLTR